MGRKPRRKFVRPVEQVGGAWRPNNADDASIHFTYMRDFKKGVSTFIGENAPSFAPAKPAERPAPRPAALAARQDHGFGLLLKAILQRKAFARLVTRF
jgi:hypothetical protein